MCNLLGAFPPKKAYNIEIFNTIEITRLIIKRLTCGLTQPKEKSIKPVQLKNQKRSSQTFECALKNLQV